MIPCALLSVDYSSTGIQHVCDLTVVRLSAQQTPMIADAFRFMYKEDISNSAETLNSKV